MWELNWQREIKYILTHLNCSIMQLTGSIWFTELANVKRWVNSQLSAVWNADVGCDCQKKKCCSCCFLLKGNWVEQCLLSLIIMWPLLFASVLWLHCLQPLKDFRRQKRSGLRASIWYNSQVTGLRGTGFLTPRVNRRITWRECDSWGIWGERVVKWLVYDALFFICYPTTHFKFAETKCSALNNCAS